MHAPAPSLPQLPASFLLNAPSCWSTTGCSSLLHHWSWPIVLHHCWRLLSSFLGGFLLNRRLRLLLSYCLCHHWLLILKGCSSRTQGGPPSAAKGANAFPALPLWHH